MAPGIKGIRFGGRKKGQKNRTTIERELREKNEMQARAEKAEKRLAELRQAGGTIAKEVLDQFMQAFASIAASYQPLPAGAPVPRGHRGENLGEFERWGRLTIEAAEKLAKYQSPQFRAIMVAPAPEARKGELVKRFTLGIFENTGRPAIAQQPQQGNGRDKAN